MSSAVESLAKRFAAGMMDLDEYEKEVDAILRREGNPLLDAFMLYMKPPTEKSFMGDWEIRSRWSYDELEPYPQRGPRWSEHMDDTFNASNARYWLQFYCSWAVPTDEAIQAIADLNLPIVEVGAGNGYWAWMLRKAGVDVVAYDKAPEGNQYACGESWTEVKKGTEKVLSDAYHDHALMLCWPPYDSTMALRCLRIFEGDALVYIGEGEGGCCGTDSFFNELETHWEEVQVVGIPQWYGLHDALFIYRRRAASASLD